jgi:glycine/D-amino acid oxidase-like deaminating enzyme
MATFPEVTGADGAAPPLSGDVEADVAIVGAGFTGLSAALALRAEGRSVVLCEGEVAGHGASGRNAGHLTPVIGKDLPTLARLFGRARARALVALAETAVAHVEATIARHAIDCGYEPVGNLLAAVHPRQHHVVDAAARAGAALGVDGELLEPEAMRRRRLPRAFTRGYLLRRGGILDPGRYVRGLRRAVLESGARLHERTRVLGVEDGPRPTLHTAAGRVRARAVVLATNAWTPDLGWLRHRVLRVHVSLFRTAPLDPARRAALGWGGREGVYTAHEMLESYRLTADDRIVGGAKRVRYAFGGRALGDDQGMDAFLESTFRARFPELGDLPVTDRWSGPIAFALDFLPAVGRTGRSGAVYHSVAYAGHGIALASYAGTMVADLLAGRDGPGAALWTRARVPLPPEPLRWLVFHALTGVFGAIDRRTDRLTGVR